MLCCAFAFWGWGSGLVSSQNLYSISWTSHWFGFCSQEDDIETIASFLDQERTLQEFTGPMTLNFITKSFWYPVHQPSSRHCSHWALRVLDHWRWSLEKHQGNDTESPPDATLYTLRSVHCHSSLHLQRRRKTQIKACSPLSASTFYKGLLQRQTTAAYKTQFTRPNVLHRRSWISSHAKILLPPDMQAKRLKTRSHVSSPLKKHGIPPWPWSHYALCLLWKRSSTWREAFAP